MPPQQWSQDEKRALKRQLYAHYDYDLRGTGAGVAAFVVSPACKHTGTQVKRWVENHKADIAHYKATYEQYVAVRAVQNHTAQNASASAATHTPPPTFGTALTVLGTKQRLDSAAAGSDIGKYFQAFTKYYTEVLKTPSINPDTSAKGKQTRVKKYQGPLFYQPDSHVFSAVDTNTGAKQGLFMTPRIFIATYKDWSAVRVTADDNAGSTEEVLQRRWVAPECPSCHTATTTINALKFKPCAGLTSWYAIMYHEFVCEHPPCDRSTFSGLDPAVICRQTTT